MTTEQQLLEAQEAYRRVCEERDQLRRQVADCAQAERDRIRRVLAAAIDVAHGAFVQTRPHSGASAEQNMRFAMRAAIDAAWEVCEINREDAESVA